MDYLKNKQKARSRVYSKVTIVFLAILLAVLVRPTWKIYEKSRESKNNLKIAQEELNSLETRKNQLASDVAYLNTDHGRDQEIRDKFGVTKEGETMVVIVRNESEKLKAVPVESPGYLERFWSGFLSTFGLD